MHRLLNCLTFVNWSGTIPGVLLHKLALANLLQIFNKIYNYCLVFSIYYLYLILEDYFWAKSGTELFGVYFPSWPISIDGDGVFFTLPNFWAEPLGWCIF